MSIKIGFSGNKWKKTAPPPTKGSIYLLYDLGIKGSNCEVFGAYPLPIS